MKKNDWIPRLASHLLRFGGCYIFGLAGYIALMWMAPWAIYQSWPSIFGTHVAVGLIAWVMYGSGGFEGDP